MLSSRSLTALALGCALLAGGCDRQSLADAQQEAAAEQEEQAAEAKLSGTLDRSHAGEQMPDFTVTNADGAELNLTSLQGKPVLVNLWATWCAPCVVELPMLDAVAEDLGDRIKVLTVSQDTQAPEKVGPFLKEREVVNLEPWLDPKADLTFKLAASTLPTTILYDAQGKELWRYVGGHDWTSKEARALIDEAFEELPGPDAPEDVSEEGQRG